MSIKRANHLSGSEWLRCSFSIWRNFGKDNDCKEHPAPFPVALVTRIIDCFVSDRNGIVLDPFAGSGSTLLAALHSGMEAIGFDLNPNYRVLFENRLPSIDLFPSQNWSYHVKDARSIKDTVKPDSVEVCITSPPYWDILNRKRSADSKQATSYSDKVQDLGNIIDYDDFLRSLKTVFSQVGKILRPQRYFILNVMDLRKGGKFFPFHQDVSRIVVEDGILTLEDIIIWDRQSEYNSMRPLGYPHKFIINKVHEYLLVFRKIAS